MTIYKYQALDLKGLKQQGIIEATNQIEAKDRLRSQGLMVTELVIRKGMSRRENLKGEALMLFTVQMATLIGAGVPLYETLIAMEETYRGEASHRIILSLANQVKAGSPLSQAMAAFPDSFDNLYRGMVAAGEASGAMSIVLQRLAEWIEKRMKLRGQIQTAMIYPAILSSFSLIVIGMLLGFVVPSIQGIFEGRELNRFTQIVLALSGFFRSYWWLYLPVGIFSIGGAVYFLKSPQGKIWLQRVSIRLPYIRTLASQAAIARFARTLGTLQEGGLPLIEALRISRETMGNVVLEKVIADAEERILAGSSFSKELGKSDIIPRLVSRMLAVGEDSGTAVPMLRRIADMYEGELEKSLTNLVSMAQPVILVFMGGIIGMVMVAILLPLTDVASLTTQ